MPPLLNRERAILEFNRRVLAQARRDDVPLLERLRYVCIVSSNLDEFFEVRFADCLEASKRPGTGIGAPTSRRSRPTAHALIDEQYARLQRRGDAGAGARRHPRSSTTPTATPAQRRWVERFFETQVRPLLVPVGLDPSHPFPQVANKSLNFIARLGGKDAFGRRNSVTIVKVPRVLPRVIRLPDALADGRQVFVLLTSVIRAHLGELFPGREVEAFSQFRITRDSDLEVDADVTNLRQALRSGLTTRHFGEAIRLEVVNTCPPELSEFLLAAVRPARAGALPVNGPVNLVRLNELIDLADAPALRFPPFEPALAGDACRAQQLDVRRACARGDAAAAPPVRVVRAGRPVPARGGRTTRTCWRSSRRSTAPAASRR